LANDAAYNLVALTSSKKEGPAAYLTVRAGTRFVSRFAVRCLGGEFRMRHRSLAWWLGAMSGAATLALFLGWSTRAGVAATDAQTDLRKPVLVELFTSEGCSSCPPADLLLARLDEMQPVNGAQVIVLSEHVTYWDHEGWRDPYSLDSVTDRQKWYGFKFGLSDVYTPQAVVDGSAQVLGSDGNKLVQAISAATAEPKAELTISGAAWTGDGIKFVVRQANAATTKLKTTLEAALAEDVTLTAVKSGENAGKTLRNVAVVRDFKEIGPGVGGEYSLRLPADEIKGASGPMRLVVFLTDKRSGRVLGAEEQTIVR
jgi:hypothetical protein